MRSWFSNTFSSRFGLYAIGAGILLVLSVSSFAAAGLLGNEGGNQVERAISPAVSQAQPPDKTGPTEAEKKAEKKKAEEEAARRAEEEAAEQAAAEQAAAEQYAEEYESWREAAAEREEPVPEEAIGTEQESPEQPAPPVGTALSLTVPGAGIYNAPVVDSVAESVLAQGAGKMPGTGFPWQPGANTYIAGHVYGYEGTGSWQLFAGLPNLGIGSEILLTDADGTTYTYQVSETLVVDPTDVWVTSPIPGQTTVSLQTCTGPGWSQRMIVRGTLV